MNRPLSTEHFVEHAAFGYVPHGSDLILEQHQPKRSSFSYHHHASIELNFLQDCKMEYSFSGKPVRIKPNRMVLFWGAAPHTVTSVKGKGLTTNIYISLSQLFHMSLPAEFVDALLSGSVISARKANKLDALMFERWNAERLTDDEKYSDLMLSELSARLKRMAFEDWDILLQGNSGARSLLGKGSSMTHVEAMLRFCSYNFSDPITVEDVAEHVGLSASHAMTLFKRVIGTPIKEHLTHVRLSHASAMLGQTDHKILSVAMDSGFQSLSCFYEAFRKRYGITPAVYRRRSRY